jgi:AraC-like DNA-binding protein
MDLILDAHFHDLDELRTVVRDWELDFRIVRKGGFSGQLRQVCSPDILVSYCRYSGSLHQTGATPDGTLTFGVPVSSCDSFWWMGQATGSDYLHQFGDCGELAAVSLSKFAIYTISVRQDALQSLVGGLAEDDRPPRASLFPMSHVAMNKLRCLARIAVFHTDGGHRARAANRLVVCILEAISASPPRKRPSARSRDRAVATVTDYLAESPRSLPEMRTLCEIANVSERTLQYAFLERYQVTPNEFVRNWQLNTARRKLRSTTDSIVRIADVAASCGFYDPSLFARNYRNLFGTLPSKDLKRSQWI